MDDFLNRQIRFRRRLARCLFALSLITAQLLIRANGILQIRNGYFWDPEKKQFVIPHGVALQTWNPPVGANQSFGQIAYDLEEFKRNYFNSIRCEIVWGQLQMGPDQYQWDKADFLIKKAEQLDLRLFILIGFQYPPAWFPPEWRGLNDRGERSDVINYEDPNARRIYTNYIATLVARYKNSPAVGAWILGNEFAYFDLWEDPSKYSIHRFLGYDSESQNSFREFLRGFYGGDIAALNRNWLTQYGDFSAVTMPLHYPENRDLPGYHDLIQWRKNSIGKFVAEGAKAAKAADPNHLITYSMVGGIFNGSDANHTAEDARSIVEACQRIGAPLDFWAINNYAWAATGSEMRSADFGISKYQETIGLPVMISETGHSSTENLFGLGAAERQPRALPSQLSEALMSGAIGIHFFHWSDRNMFTTNYFYRERGFGIVSETRVPKEPVFSNVVSLFRRLEEIRIGDLLGGSTAPPRDILFYWSRQSDMGYPRANQENAMMWGALKRLGYQPGIIGDEQFAQRAFTNGTALLLSRAFQLDPSVLETILNQAIPAGIHVHANADLPGQFNAYHHPNTNWTRLMKNLFGLDVTSASPGIDGGATDSPARSTPLVIKGASTVGDITPDFATDFVTWKIWHGIRATGGITALTHTGSFETQPPMPALQLTDHGTARAAINTFALGDTFNYRSDPVLLWDARYTILRTIYRDFFGMQPRIELSGVGATYVMPDYRILHNGTILVSLMNERTNTADVQINAPFLRGMEIQNLSSGSIVERTVGEAHEVIHLEGDQFLLLYAYPNESQSLVADRAHLMFTSAPPTVWSGESTQPIRISYQVKDSMDLRIRLEQTQPVRRILAESGPASVLNQGMQSLTIVVPDANAKDTNYTSSLSGAEYRFVATLENSGVVFNQIALPVQLAIAATVRGVPSQPQAGTTYEGYVEWEYLPSIVPGQTNLPMDRATWWHSLDTGRDHYEVEIDVFSGDSVVSKDVRVVHRGTGTEPFKIQIPSDAGSPLHWVASVRPAPQVESVGFEDGFEGLERGAEWQADNMQMNAPAHLTSPLVSYVYSELAGGAQWQNEGVNLEGNGGGQSGFLVVTNNLPGSFSGFGFQYNYPTTWALPPNRNCWSGYRFSVDFYEENRRPALIELQLKNPTTSLKIINLIKQYEPDSNGWCHVEASLDEFIQPSYSATFDPAAVGALVVNIQMIQTHAQYVGFFDNISFTGPEKALAVDAPIASYRSDNDDPVSDISRSWNIGSISKSASEEALISWKANPNESVAVYYSDDVTFFDERLVPEMFITRIQTGDGEFVEVRIPSNFATQTRFFRALSIARP